MDPAHIRRPRLLAGIVALGAMLTALIAIDANGYFVPAAVALLVAAMLWRGRGAALVRWLTVLNLASGLLLVLVLAFGDPLGAHKLDVSGAALLTNLASGGPALALVALPLLRGLRPGQGLARWFSRA